jgi:hypothetical protein
MLISEDWMSLPLAAAGAVCAKAEEMNKIAPEGGVMVAEGKRHRIPHG